MPDAPRKPGRPRKVVEPEATPEPINVPPGPIQLEIRAGNVREQTKIVCSRPVYSYTIDQQNDTFTVTGNLRPAE